MWCGFYLVAPGADLLKNGIGGILRIVYGIMRGFIGGTQANAGQFRSNK
jgi:hypothetical protein